MRIHFCIVLVVLFTLLMSSCKAQNKGTETIPQKSWALEFPHDINAPIKTEEEWKKELNRIEYQVLREKSTERPFTGDLLKNKKKGYYVCRGCGLPLFASDAKFNSGTGWPSFYKPVKEAYVAEEDDFKIGYKRTEVLCARCDGHLGHVFPDGPKPTGLRYCINAVSLDFVESSEAPK